MQWARAHLRSKREWKCVLWSDESTFQLVPGKNEHQILSPKDQRDHPDFHQWQMQKQMSVMIWGCSTSIKITSFMGSPWLLNLDNASSYSAFATTAWFRRYRVNVLEWHAYSPVLSRIENVWPVMKRRIRQWWLIAECWASEALCQLRLDKKFFQNFNNSYPQFPNN